MANHYPLYANDQPRYVLADIQSMVTDGNWEFANDLAEKNYEDYGWTEDKLIRFVSCLRAPVVAGRGDYRKTLPAQGIYKGSNVVDVDVYKLHFDEETLARGNSSDCCYYIKLAILSDKDGSYVGVSSFHLDTFK